MAYLLVLALGLAAGVISGIVGFGSSIMLMPALIIVFGPQEAVPIMAVAAIMANASRVMVWWRDIEWKVVWIYAVTAAPAAALGARTLLVLPAQWVETALGIFFIAMVPVRRALGRRNITLKRWQFALGGVLIGYFSGIVASTGPINAPLFLALGLVKGAFLGTEAMSSLVMYSGKVAVFGGYGYLPWSIVTQGLIIGGSLMAGAYIAKGFVLRLEAERFRSFMEVMLLMAGVTMLWAALGHPHDL